MTQLILNLFKKPQQTASIPQDRLVRVLLSQDERSVAREWMGQANPYRFKRCN